MSEELELQMSSTTLGYEGEGGKVGAATALVEKLISKDRYTDLVIKNALRAKDITELEFPDQEIDFSISSLASAVTPEKLKDTIEVGSVDYPYDVDMFSKETYRIKKAEVDRQGRTGVFERGMSFALEYAYASLQSPTVVDQLHSTVEMVKLIKEGTPRLRTCIAMAMDDEKLKTMRKVNAELGGDNSVIWAVEPNRGIGDGTLSDYISTLMKVKRDNPDLTFGIDLDLGGLPQEDNRSILELLDVLDNDKLLPVFLSLSGQNYLEEGFRTHLPLGNSVEFAKKLGEWIKVRQARGQKLPAFLVETSPADPEVLKDYANFLANLKTGIR